MGPRAARITFRVRRLRDWFGSVRHFVHSCLVSFCFFTLFVRVLAPCGILFVVVFFMFLPFAFFAYWKTVANACLFVLGLKSYSFT